MISKLTASIKCSSGIKLRHIMLAALVIQAVGCGGQDKDESKQAVKNQPPATQAPQEKAVSPAPPPQAAKPLNTIESLVAPIALYPDPLLAEVLVASTYPLEVVQAARWLESKPDPETVKSKNWDASVMRLTAVPAVISMMSEHLDWTTQLGDAFLAQPKEVMDSVQVLRKRAIDAGFLKDSDLQKVTTQTVSATEPAPAEGTSTEIKATPAVLTREIITIQPAKADTISVPSYNPEKVFGASLAAPPATTADYSASSYPAAPAPAYYPSYYPAPATTTTSSSSSDDLMTFASGAVVGGLLTWGIMEWADDDDDWDDDYHVMHGYGNTVCHSGNCWQGGGYYGGGGGYNRGVINSGDINISGNEINIDRDGTFKADQLPAFKDRGGSWKPDPRHRRGQPYPALAENRLGKIQQPALPGNRLGNAQTLPANFRGYGTAGTPGTRQSQARLSSADIQQQLKARSGNESIRTPSAKGATPAIASRENALESLRSSGQALNLEKGRGAASVNRASVKASPAVTKKGAIPASKTIPQRGTSPAKQPARVKETRVSTAQGIESQRRLESSRPSAFESAGKAAQTSQFSQRGATSRASVQSFNRPGTSSFQRPAGGGLGQRGQAPRPSGGGTRQRGGLRR